MIALSLSIVLAFLLLYTQRIYFQSQVDKLAAHVGDLEEMLLLCSEELQLQDQYQVLETGESQEALIESGDKAASNTITATNTVEQDGPSGPEGSAGTSRQNKDFTDPFKQDDMSDNSQKGILPGTAVNEPAAAANDPAASYKTVMTTLFWVGEPAGSENDYISNQQSYWDEDWQGSFGGIDDPADRCGYQPCAFEPQENPFYFALPYGEYAPDYGLKESLKKVPWYEEQENYRSILKNRWIEIRANGKTAYAQWQDVGPIEMDDFDYVFGDKPPRNSWGAGAGLDISPAVWDYLGMATNQQTSWRFVEFTEVPEGPWLEKVTE